MSKFEPHNDISLLIAACDSADENVVVWDAPKVDLGYFNIFGGKKELKQVVAGNELDNLKYVPPPKPLDKWNAQGSAPIVDGYKFKLGNKEGYIAYFKAPTENWVIKSFHKDGDALTNKLIIDSSKLSLSTGGNDDGE